MNWSAILAFFGIKGQGKETMKNVPHQENAPGPFYVCQGQYLLCEAPLYEAPDLMGWSADKQSCLFLRQPSNPEETARAISAMNVSCIQALRYSGNDPAILQKLKGLALGHCCDAITNLKKE